MLKFFRDTVLWKKITHQSLFCVLFRGCKMRRRIWEDESHFHQSHLEMWADDLFANETPSHLPCIYLEGRIFLKVSKNPSIKILSYSLKNQQDTIERLVDTVRNPCRILWLLLLLYLNLLYYFYKSEDSKFLQKLWGFSFRAAVGCRGQGPKCDFAAPSSARCNV